MCYDMMCRQNTAQDVENPPRYDMVTIEGDRFILVTDKIQGRFESLDRDDHIYLILSQLRPQVSIQSIYLVNLIVTNPDTKRRVTDTYTWCKM